MSNRVRINLANPAELLSFRVSDPNRSGPFSSFRAEHGPIQDASQLAKVLGGWPGPRRCGSAWSSIPRKPPRPKRPGA